MAGKTHIFIAYSNLHLLFAQALARSLPAGDRKILWLSAIKDDSPLYQLYQALIVPGLWADVKYITFNRSLTASVFRRSPVKLASRVREIREGIATLVKTLPEASQPCVLWIPHQFDLTCKIAAVLTKEAGGEVNFYEEGMSVYFMQKPSSERRFKHDFNAALFRLVAAKHARIEKPLASYLDRLYLSMPSRKYLVAFSGDAVACDLTKDFDRAYLDWLPAHSGMSSHMAAAVARYPRGPFVLILLSVEIEDKIFPVDAVASAIRSTLPAILDGVDHVVIKPHPRTKPATLEMLKAHLPMKVSIVTEEFPIPVEMLVGQLPVKAVFGGICSSLVYLNQLYDLNCYSYLKALAARRDELNEWQAKYLGSLMDACSEHVQYL